MCDSQQLGVIQGQNKEESAGNSPNICISCKVMLSLKELHALVRDTLRTRHWITSTSQSHEHVIEFSL